ncbi:hypothetical protein BHE74_00009461, partial [Ensete ventricosum]
KNVAARCFFDANVMATTKRAYKLRILLVAHFLLNPILTRVNLEEFVAHSSNVNSLKIGRRTSRVLVTGGEDHKVNLWAIGKPNAILLWDLTAGKLLHDFKFHEGQIRCIDFHPHEFLLATG